MSSMPDEPVLAKYRDELAVLASMRPAFVPVLNLSAAASTARNRMARYLGSTGLHALVGFRQRVAPAAGWRTPPLRQPESVAAEKIDRSCGD
jgi:hypothetical protein